MYIRKRVTQKVLHFVLGCDFCGKPIKNNAVFVAIRKIEKGINNRRLWTTVKKFHYHRKCAKNKFDFTK